MKILVDDIRTDINLNIKVDVIFRDPGLVKRFIKCQGCDHLYLDHDMGLKSITGYDLLSDLELNGMIPDAVTLVTDNPVGRLKMEACLAINGYIKRINVWRKNES